MEKYITLIVKDSENPELEVEEKFQIYTTDSLETIKNRYFQLKKIVPPIGSFEILKKENELSEESSQPIKKLSDLGETIVKDVPIILKHDKEWSVNPLEDSIIRLVTFFDVINKLEVIEQSSVDYAFNLVFSKVCLESKKLFAIEDKDTVLFAIVMTLAATTGDSSYEDSWNIIREDYDYLGLYDKVKNKENEYKRYFENIIKDYGDYQYQKKQKERVKFETFLNQLNLESFSDIKKYNEDVIGNPAKTDVVQMDYAYTGKCTLEYDGYELFNIIKPDKFISFLNIGKFYKLLNNFNYPYEFLSAVDEEDDSILRLYIFGKPSEDDVDIVNPNHKDYFLVELIQIQENKGLFDFEILIQASKQIQLTEFEIIRRTIASLSFINDSGSPAPASTNLVCPTNIELKKTFGRGFCVYKNINIPRELLFDFATNHPYVSQMLVFDEKYKIEKERGEPRFLLSLNNFETSIKCSINNKTIKKKSEPEVVAFPMFAGVGENVITITILRANNQGEMYRLIDYFEKLMVYVLKNKEKFFVDFYKNFISNIDSIFVQKKKDDKQLDITDINPDLFIPTYPRFCQPSPIIIEDRKQIEELKKNPDQLMLFPKTEIEGTQYYYSCNHRASTNFIGLKKNKLDNSAKYPYVPCCYKTSQLKPGKLRYNYEREIQETDEKKTFVQVITSSKKVLQQNQYGNVASDIKVLLSSIDENILTGNYRVLRRGVEKSINSAISALLTASGYTSSIDSINKVRTKINNLAYYNLSSQRGLLPTNIVKIIKNENNIDPVLFLDLLENIFKKNIIVFCNPDMKTEKDQSINGSLCDYKQLGTKNNKFSYKLLYSSKKFVHPDTVLLLRTYGSEFDALQYPHTEIIGIEENKISSATENRLIKKLKMLFPTSSNFIKNLINIYSENVSHEVKYLPLNSKIINQVEDSYGKIRSIFVKFSLNETEHIINLFVTPVANFNEVDFVPSSELERGFSENQQIKNISNNEKVELSVAHQFLISESMSNIKVVEINNIITGIVGYSVAGQTLVYVPVKVSNNKINLPKYDLSKYEYPYPNIIRESLSLIEQYSEYKKLSNFIISNTLYLFSQLHGDDLEFVQYVSTTDDYDDSIRNLVNEFDKRIIVDTERQDKTSYKLNRNLSLNNETIIKNQSLLLVPSARIKRKLLYVIYINAKYNINEIINYRYKKYVSDYYVNVKDFVLGEHYSLFYTKTELNFTKNPPNNYNIISSITNIFDSVFYFKNDSVLNGKLCILQKCIDLENALFVCSEWDKQQINTWNQYAESNKLDLNSVNYILYLSGELQGQYESTSVINNSSYRDVGTGYKTYYVLLTKFKNIESIFYYAILPVKETLQNKIHFDVVKEKKIKPVGEIEFEFE